MPFPGLTPEAKDRVIERNGHALTVVALALGVVIISTHIESGSQRWSAAVWVYALQVPGSPATWGVVILAAGILLAIGHLRHSRPVRNLGYRVAFLWCCLVSGAQLFSLIDDSASLGNPIGIVLWLYMAYIYRERVLLSDKRSYA